MYCKPFSFQGTVTTTKIRNCFAHSGFTNLVNDGNIPPTGELDAMKDLQRLQNHEEFLKIDNELPCCNINDQNYDNDIIKHMAKMNK